MVHYQCFCTNSFQQLQFRYGWLWPLLIKQYRLFIFVLENKYRTWNFYGRYLFKYYLRLDFTRRNFDWKFWIWVKKTTYVFKMVLEKCEKLERLRFYIKGRHSSFHFMPWLLWTLHQRRSHFPRYDAGSSQKSSHECLYIGKIPAKK